MPRCAEVGALAETSYWLAQTLAHVIQLHTGLAAIDPSFRSESLRLNAGRLADAEDRLALALEAYGEVIRSGDRARVARIVRELEVPNGATRRPTRQRDYPDLIRRREDDRALRRRLERLKGKLEQLTAEGAPASASRPLRTEIRVLEELFG